MSKTREGCDLDRSPFFVQKCVAPAVGETWGFFYKLGAAEAEVLAGPETFGR